LPGLPILSIAPVLRESSIDFIGIQEQTDSTKPNCLLTGFCGGREIAVTSTGVAAKIASPSMIAKFVARFRNSRLKNDRCSTQISRDEKSSANLSYNLRDLLVIGGLPRTMLQGVHCGTGYAPL
jgi:hypothetical protein